MALRACIECKKEISTDATTCPNCGKKSPHGGTVSIVKLTVLFAGFVVGGIWFAINSQRSSTIISDESSAAQASLQATKPLRPSAPDRPTSPAIDVDATTLWQEYQANEVAADSRYKGKSLSVLGFVSAIQKDVVGDMLVKLRSPNEFMGTLATMAKSEAGSVAKLSKGQKVVLLCRGAGMTLGSPMLRECAVRAAWPKGLRLLRAF